METCFLGYVELRPECRYYNLQVGQTLQSVYHNVYTTYIGRVTKIRIFRYYIEKRLRRGIKHTLKIHLKNHEKY